MAHHWTARGMLERDIGTEDRWTMFDKGRRVGRVERVTIRGRVCFRGWDPDGIWILGYAPTLEEAAKRLWAWDAARLKSLHDHSK